MPVLILLSAVEILLCVTNVRWTKGGLIKPNPIFALFPKATFEGFVIEYIMRIAKAGMCNPQGVCKGWLYLQRVGKVDILVFLMFLHSHSLSLVYSISFPHPPLIPPPSSISFFVSLSLAPLPLSFRGDTNRNSNKQKQRHGSMCASDSSIFTNTHCSTS